MKGLLDSAETIRDDDDNSSGSGDSIISSEEQNEILKEIDKISGQSRIDVTPELFKISAVKKGILFPLLVNIVAFSLLGGGIYATKYYFDQVDQDMVRTMTEQQSSEGKIIKELKLAADKELAEKENEINGIQAKMKEVESERLDLERNMNSKISDKESQLQQEMEAALEEEREKLRSQGMTTDQINQQIANMQLEQSSLFDQKLSDFREEAQLKKIDMEKQLDKLSNEYNSDLEKFNTERDKIKEEAEAVLAEQTEKMEAKARELESEKSEAQKEIQRLTDQQKQEDLVESQIVGFYKNIEDYIKNGDLDRASGELENLEKYLYDETVITYAGISKRREIDLFVIDSLSNMVESSRVDPQEELDTMSLIQAADKLQEIQKIVSNADQQIASGNTELAEIMYQNALKAIPEIYKSHNYFIDSMQTELEAGYEQLADIQNQFDEFKKEYDDRKTGVENLLAAADSKYDSGDYNTAVKEYQNAIKATGINDIDQAAVRMIESGNTLAIAPFKERISSLSAEMTDLKESSDGSLMEMQSLENDVEDMGKEIAEYSRKITVFNDKLETEKQQVVSLKDEIEKQNNQISIYEQKIETMKVELENEKNKESTTPEESKLIDEEIAELTTLTVQLNRLSRSYADFELMASSLKDNLQGDAETIEALYDFFEDDSVDNVFPGISDYLRSFSNVYLTAGTEIGLYEGISLMYDLNSMENNNARLELLGSKREQYKDNSAMLELISQIEKSMKQVE